MKGKKAGGRAESPMKGDDDAEMDIKDKPERRDNATKIEDEAEERKRGGRTRKKKGGLVACGMDAKHHAGRKPRKAGGRTGSNFSPLSSAARGEAPMGRKGLKVG